jgi:2-aminoadipate transaminase
MAKESDKFAYYPLFRSGLPPPARRFAGLLPYNFSGGHNDAEQIPIDALIEASVAVLKRHGSRLAIYNLGHGPLGYEGLRDVVATKLAKRRGIACSRDDILITAGSTQGLNLLNQIFLQPGDTVVFEEFSYANAIRDMRQLGVTIVSAPLDSGGLEIDALDSILGNLRDRRVHPKYIYTIPTIQNPTGTILSLDRRHKLLSLAEKFQTVVIEDECYSNLVWADDVPPSLYGLNPKHVIHVGSLSKSLAPALRLGFIVADWQVLSQAIACKTDGGTGALEQMVAAEYFFDSFDSHIAGQTRALESKLGSLVEALQREFGTSIEFHPPEGGTFIWAKLPPPIDVRKLIQPAANAGIAFNPGPEWSCGDDPATSHLRLCFALPTAEQIQKGIAELARICFDLFGIPERGTNASRRIDS